MKIAILGYSDSGKSTLARQLADYYNIPVLFLDTVQFKPGWAERDKDEGRKIVLDFMQKNDSWVIDGNYRGFYRDERLELADMIIYLKFPRLICLIRAFKRYFKYKNKTRESMADGCIEKIDMEFIWWILYKGRTKGIRDQYDKILSHYKDKAVILKSKKQVDKFLHNTII